MYYYIVTETKQAGRKMYKANITKNNEGTYYALVIRVDADGYQNVIAHYAGRFFKTEKAAIKSTSNYISKFC
mgnify:FL=1|tara:strand:+ start:955 stop:1170 length:216 start_codon:yes stop_codon:yes gene_type:complete